MIKGRDRIEFTRKNWPGQTELVIEYFVFAGVAAILVLLGLFLIARQTFSTLSSTIKQQQLKSQVVVLRVLWLHQ